MVRETTAFVALYFGLHVASCWIGPRADIKTEIRNERAQPNWAVCRVRTPRSALFYGENLMRIEPMSCVVHTVEMIRNLHRNFGDALDVEIVDYH
jgi:hypothetical protein